jgi:hypothetical protein
VTPTVLVRSLSLLTDEGYGSSMITVLGDLDAETESRIDALPAIGLAVPPALNVICVACAGTGRCRFADARTAGRGI